MFNNTKTTGGAISSTGTTLKINHTNFYFNSANVTSNILLHSAKITVSDLEYDSFFRGYSHSIYNQSSTTWYTLSVGGAFSISNSTTVMENSKLVMNSAMEGGGIFIVDSDVSISASLFSKSANGVRSVLVAAYCSLTMETTMLHNITIVDGYAVTGNVKFSNVSTSDPLIQNILGSEKANTTSYGVSKFYDSVVTIRYCTFTAIINSAVTFAKCRVYIKATQFIRNEVKYIQVLSFSNSNVTIVDCNFTKNFCHEVCLGSAIGAMTNSTIAIYKTSFNNNSGLANSCAGGAIFIGDSTAYINESIFSNNKCFSLDDQDIFNRTQAGAIAAFNGFVFVNNTTFQNNSATHTGGAVSLMYSTLNMEQSVCINNSAHNGGAIALLTGPKTALFIRKSSFINSSAYDGGAVLTIGISITISILHTTFRNNKADRFGGALYLGNVNCSMDTIELNNNRALSEGGAIYSTNSVFLIRNIVIQNSLATTHFYVAQCTVLFLGSTLFANNVGSLLAFVSNITFTGHTQITNNSYTTYNNLQHLNIGYGGALSSFQSDITLRDEVILNNNKGTTGGVMLLIESKLYSGGSITVLNNIATENGGAIYAQKSELKFNGRCNVSNNVAYQDGGGIYAKSSTIALLQGSLHFFENNARNGGGLYFEYDSKLYVIKAQAECLNNSWCEIDELVCLLFCNNNNRTWISLMLSHNHATHYGGAVYISDNTTTASCKPECFIQTLAGYNEHHLEIDTNLLNIYFFNNTADVSGQAIFGGLLDRCTINFLAEIFILLVRDHNIDTYMSLDGISYLFDYNITNVSRNEAEFIISSSPVSVCFCANDQPLCNLTPTTFTVSKGETFTLTLVAVDQVNNTLPNSTIYSIVSSHAGLKEGQSTQFTLNEGCTKLEYNIFSTQEAERLFIYADGPCKDNKKSTKFIDIIFAQCPLGFVDTESTCDCDPVIFPNFVTKCSAESHSLLLKRNVWLSYDNTTNIRGFIMHSFCPFDYCSTGTKSVWINFDSSEEIDKQCASYRTGKLCGSCKSGYSLSFGNSSCKKCSSYWLALLILFAACGILLVAFLLMCNLTVPVGTLNGLILYANIVASNSAIFIPFETPNVLTVFIAWINLDFGFETCFFSGMDGYIKTWLQLAFPIYTLCLVAAVIVVSEHSKRFAAVIARKNPVATLATLILLSYTKLLRTIIAALSFTKLKYSNDSYEIVWLVDANIFYLESKHLPLFIAAFIILLFGLIYTIVLFFWQWLLLCPRKKLVMWIRNSRLHAFMDAYLNPYNKKHRYWTGLLLLTRAVLYLTVALNFFGDPKINLVAIVCLAGCLILLKETLMRGKIYKKWTLSMLESSFLYNLTFFAVTTLYVRETAKKQDVLAYISLSVAFITFLLILTYHFYCFILRKPLEDRKHKRLLRQMLSKASQNEIEIQQYPDIFTDSEVSVTEIEGLPTIHDTDENDLSNDTENSVLTGSNVNSIDFSECSHNVVNFSNDMPQVEHNLQGAENEIEMVTLNDSDDERSPLLTH